MNAQKRVKRQNSRPIIGWLQKKLGGSGRAARQPTVRVPGERPRAATVQQLEIPPRSSDLNHIVLNDDDVSHMGRSTPPRSSRSSTWSPSNPEADDDASIRPLPPTSPPSPAPSRSSSSYLSDPRTFGSVTTSTKPTTLMSIDLGTNGMAHIAQAPATPTTSSTPHSALPRFSTTSSSSVVPNSITFSALPPVYPTSRSENHSLDPGTVQAPLHTSHHPRYNPRPSSPPQDNASVLTLASSAFAFPGGRIGGWVGDSQSQFALDNNSQHGELEVDEAQVENASVRALRPRSSRRGSWESEVSGWSARVNMARERSLRANSWKAGAQDGDGSTDLTGEEIEGSEGKSTHGPSPLATNIPTTGDLVSNLVEQETKAHPAKEAQELNVAPETGPDDRKQEFERTPPKTLLTGTDDTDEIEEKEELTEKLGPVSDVVVGIRTACRVEG